MKWIAVDSSNISALKYDEKERILSVRFHQGATYEFFHVPRSVFEGLMGAASKGQHFHQHVKGKYEYRRIN